MQFSSDYHVPVYFCFFECVKIVINTRFLLDKKLEGFGRFTDEICKRLVANHPEHDFYFLFDRPYADKFIYGRNVHPVVLRPAARHPILFYIWFEWRVKKFLKKLNPDIFVSPDGHLSLDWEGKQLAVIHDLNFEHYPQDLPDKDRKYLKKYFPKFAARADRIVTVSEFSKMDISKQYGVNPNQIDVVYNAADDGFKPIDEQNKLNVQAQITNGVPYFVYLGSLHPRKNIHRLFQAYEQFKQQSGSQTKLVIIGDAYWFNDSMQKSYQTLQFKKDITFTGHLEFSKMQSVLASAQALCYLSYFEGFGIPIVEAMKCGVPVICGDRTSIPEVAGDAALTVNPFEISEIVNAMTMIDDSDELRMSLSAKGLIQSQKFNWDKSAELFWQSIETTLG